MVFRRRFPALFLIALAVAPLAVRGGDDPLDPDAGLRRILRDHLARRDYPAVLRAADDTLRGRPRAVIAWQYRAYALHQLGRLDEARAAYRTTVELDPANWWAHMNLGSLLASMGQWDAAGRSAATAVKLNRRSRETWARLVRIRRDRGRYEKAATTVRRALMADIDPAWVHAQLGYLTWVIEDLESSRAHWQRARELGADPEACAHGLRLAEWGDRRPADPRERAAITKRRLGAGEPWVFRVGRIEVHTRVGPELPAAAHRLLLDLQEEQAAFLGIKGDWSFDVELHLARTVEEHERRRRAAFPRGYPGKAYHVDRRAVGGVVAGAGGRPVASLSGSLQMFAAWSEPGLLRSLSHELAHALVRVRASRASDIPPWLDEGLATYLELAPDVAGRLRPGTVRADMLEVVCGACAAEDVTGWEAMLATSRPAFSGPFARRRYAEAWSMVHFLIEGQRTGGRPKLLAYLDSLGGAGRGFRDHYGRDLSAMHEAWVDHVMGMLPD